MPPRLDLKLPRNNSLIASMLPCLGAPSRPAYFFFTGIR